MTSNQRRPGFRLPWSSEEEAAEAASQADNGTTPGDEADVTPPPDTAGEAQPEAQTAEAVDGGEASDAGTTGASEFEAPAAAPQGAAVSESQPEAQPEPAPAPETSAPAVPGAVAEAGGPAAATSEASGPSGESPVGFMRDLVAAMRGVAEETRQASLTQLRASSEDRVRTLDAETETRSAELRERADADIAAVGDWARAEEERIKQDAEQKVVARRAQLDQQLAAESSRAQSAGAALRERVAAYERELDTYHAQLSDIADPAAFAAAAKRMPAPPDLGSPIAVPTPVEPPRPDPAVGEATGSDSAGDGAPETTASDAAGDSAEGTAMEPAQSEAGVAPETGAALATDAAPETGVAPEIPAEAQPPTEPAAEAAPQARRGDTAATEVLVKGLGSFGAITGFRQALAGVEGIDGVSLSLGPTGEFVFRAIHPAGFDVAAAITSIEGDAAKIEERPEGGIRVTLDRSR